MLVITGKDRGKRGRVLKVVPDEEPPGRRRREHDQAPHEAEPAARTSRAASSSARRRCTRATCSWCARSAARRRASATRSSATAARSASAASAREWSTNEPAEREVPEGRRAGAHEGVRLHERDGRARRSRRSSSTWASARRRRTPRSSTPAPTSSARITGQKPVTRRAKKSIAQFKVRKGMPIGTMVTLRGERMWEFLDRLMSIALPRVRDFKGVSPQGLRRPRQLHARPARSAAVPRDRLHEGRQGARHERVGRDDGEDRRGSAEAAAVHRHAVPAE